MSSSRIIHPSDVGGASRAGPPTKSGLPNRPPESTGICPLTLLVLLDLVLAINSTGGLLYASYLQLLYWCY